MKHILSLLIVISIFPALLRSQNDSALVRLNAFVKDIQTFNLLYPQEKVYLHFDNTGYFLGETIWFKAYVTVASTLAQTPLSRVLYVELINEEGYIMESRKFKIENGQAHGDIPLTKMGMKSGFFEVRAYTRLMLNWDKEVLFSRVFPVFEAPAKEGVYSKKQIRRRSTDQHIPVKREVFRPDYGTKKVNVSFYPEGGTLVEGLPSVVAFKATDSEGRSLEVEGEVRNTEGDILAFFSTHHQGMGSFEYTPRAGESNKVYIISEDKEYEFSLPKVSPSGVVLSVNALHPDYVSVHIRRRAVEEWNSPLGLVVSCRGQVTSFYAVDLSKEEECSVRIPRNEFSDGVGQVTLLDPLGTIHAERLLFVNKGRSLHISGSWDKPSYAPMEQVRMDFTCSTDSGVPMATTFSLSVRDAASDVSFASHGTLQTNLLLSSDLKGFIEDAEYYFESDNRAHRLSLDLLMLTQGWYRYRTKQMMGKEPFEATHKIEKGIVIDGSVRTITRKKGVEDVDVKMWLYSLDDGSFQQGSCPTDASGRFNFLPEDFYGKYELQLETKQKDKRKEYWISLDRQFAPVPRAYSNWDRYFPQSRTESKTDWVWVEDGMEESDSLELLRLTAGKNLLKNVTVRAEGAWDPAMVQKSSIVYDVAEEEDRMVDNMSGYNETFLEFLARTNPYFNYEEYDYADEQARDIRNPKRPDRKLPCYKSPEYPRPVFCTYKGRAALFVVDGVRIDATSYYNQTIMASDVEKVYILESRDDFMRYYFSPTGKVNDTPEVEAELARDEAESKERENQRAALEKGDQYDKPKLFTELNAYPITFNTFNRQFVTVFLQTYKKGTKHREPVGVRKTHLMGFSSPREFYSPNYKEYALPDESDYRRTLYWNPNVKTDSGGKASVSFYNNNSCEEMNVSAETITPDGIPGGYYGE